MAIMNTEQDKSDTLELDTNAIKRKGPLHKWLADQIRNKVAHQHLQPGTPLEPEVEMAQRYQVSRGTVRQAMATLVHEGLIDRQAGRGSFIRATPTLVNEDPKHMDHHWAGIKPKVSRIRVLVDCDVQPTPGHFILADSIEGLSNATAEMNGSCKLTYEYHRVKSAQDAVAKAFMNQDDCEGMILLPTGQECINFLNQMGKPAKPTAVLYRRITNPHVHRFAIDNFTGAYQATDYLLRMGHRRIALLILTWPDSWPSTLERLEGYRQAMRHAGCEDPDLVATANSPSNPSEVREACRKLFDCEDHPTAFLVNNMANLAPSLDALHDLNLQIPEDVSVLAFDESKEALAHDPQISVVHMPLVRNAMQAMKHLLLDITNHKLPGSEHLTCPEIRLRQSCRPLISLAKLTSPF
jgi:DNA-binding LacI/PurR family transcriptional regulator/DNA-binding transcriptional regulator YhcF (GntR family)